MKKWVDSLPPEAIAVANELAAKAREETDKGKTIYPPQGDIFNALKWTPPDAVKTVIIGQDPYINPGQAHGLAFSVKKGANAVTPPSLINIHKELCDEYGVEYAPGLLDTDLSPWAREGVLLLNASLTVQRGMSNSHADWGWDKFTGAVIRQCFLLSQPVVFLLWGSYARNLVQENMPDRSLIKDKWCIATTHPSPFSAAKSTATAPAFLGSQIFATANSCLAKYPDVTPIPWLDAIRSKEQ